MGDHEQHIATDNNSPGILHISYTTEIPGHNPNDHVTNTEREQLMANLGTGMEQAEPMRFDTAQQLMEYQAGQRTSAGPYAITGVSSFDTNTELNAFDQALLEAAYVNEQNQGLIAAGSHQRYTLGGGTAAYLQTLGINPNYISTTGTVTRDFDQIDSHLSDTGIEDYDHVFIQDRDSNWNSDQGPLPLTSTTDAYIAGYHPDTTARDATGGAAIVVGSGVLAGGGVLGYASYQGLQALGTVPEASGGGVTGAMMGYNSAGAVTELNPLSVGAGGTMAGGNVATGTIGGTVAGGAGAEMPMYSEVNPMFSGGGAAPPSTPSSGGLRYRGPTARQVGQLISTGGSSAATMGTGVVEGAATLEAGTSVAIGAGVVGVAAILGGIALVASGPDDEPTEVSGHVNYNAAAGPDNPDPLSNVRYGMAEANYMNNMDQVYLQNGATPEQMRTIHEYYAGALNQQNTDAGVRAGFQDLQGQYGMAIEDRREAVPLDRGGHTANSGGGGGDERPARTDNDGHTVNTGGGSGTTTTTGDNEGITAGTGGGGGGGGEGEGEGEGDNPLVDPNQPVNPYEPDLDPLNPAEFPGTFDNTNYRGTGYSYFAFMGLPRWLQLKLLKGRKLDDDDEEFIAY